MERIYKETGQLEFTLPYFCSAPGINLRGADLNELYHKMTDVILEKIVNYNKVGTDLKFKQVLSLEINIAEYEPLRGSSYIPLRPELSKKKAIEKLEKRERS